MAEANPVVARADLPPSAAEWALVVIRPLGRIRSLVAALPLSKRHSRLWSVCGMGGIGASYFDFVVLVGGPVRRVLRRPFGPSRLERAWLVSKVS